LNIDMEGFRLGMLSVRSESEGSMEHRQETEHGFRAFRYRVRYRTWAWSESDTRSSPIRVLAASERERENETGWLPEVLKIMMASIVFL